MILASHTYQLSPLPSSTAGKSALQVAIIDGLHRSR